MANRVGHRREYAGVGRRPIQVDEPRDSAHVSPQSYSVRSAVVGSMFKARRVGTRHASMQTPIMTSP